MQHADGIIFYCVFVGRGLFVLAGVERRVESGNPDLALRVWPGKTVRLFPVDGTKSAAAAAVRLRLRLPPFFSVVLSVARKVFSAFNL